MCDKYDILLVADEVITGFGRAGDWFGSRVWGVAPDIMCLAKAITSGYFPLGAVMLNEKIESAFMQDQEQLAAIYTTTPTPGTPSAAPPRSRLSMRLSSSTCPEIHWHGASRS